MKEKDLFYLVVSIFILSVIWISFNIYNSFATSTIDQVLQEQITPINPTFDRAMIEKLKERNKAETVTTFTPNSEAITPTITPGASPAAELEDTVTQTEEDAPIEENN